MKTPKQWINENIDKNVQCGHGEYWDLPKRMTEELIKQIQEDALKTQQENLEKIGRALHLKTGMSLTINLVIHRINYLVKRILDNKNL